MKIHITGNAGSGKTTLANHIGKALGLPVFGLDSVVWASGWRKTSAEERAPLEERLIAQADWVIDGVSVSVIRAADVIILLDVDRLTSYRRCACRNWRYLFRSRPGLPDGCPELLIIPRLCQLIWRFPTRVLPRLLQDIESSDARFFRVGNERDLEAVLESLGISSDGSVSGSRSRA